MVLGEIVVGCKISRHVLGLKLRDFKHACRLLFYKALVCVFYLLLGYLYSQ